MLLGARSSLGSSRSDDGGHGLVEHFAEEVDPFFLGDLAVTVGIELGEELSELSLVDVMAATLRAGNGDELLAVDGTVTVGIELLVLHGD